MDNDFFESSGGGDPAYQHIVWYLGHPSVWLTFFLWSLVLIAAFKIAKRLWRVNKTQWLILFLVAVGIALISYIWLSTNAFYAYVEGLGYELRGLRYAKYTVILLSIMSGFWIITDWFKTRR